MNELYTAAKQLRPTMVGFALLVALEQYIHFRWPYQGPQEVVAFFGIQIVVLGILAVVFRFRPVPRILESVASIAASFVVAVVLIYAATGRPLAFGPLLLCGAVFAILYLPWFRALGNLGTRQAFVAVFGSQIVAGVIGAASAPLPASVKPIVFAACALGSSVCAVDASRETPAALPASSYEKGDRREPSQYAVLLFLFGISAGYFNQGGSGLPPIGSEGYFALWSAGSAVLAACCVALVLKQRVEPSLNLVWRLFVVIILACCLGMQAFPDVPSAQAVISCIVCMLRTTAINVFTLAMVDIARYARWNASAVLCGGYALSIFSFLLPEAVGIVAQRPLSSIPGFWIIAFAVISCSLLLVRERDFSTARVFAELCEPAKPVSAYDAMEAQCVKTAQRYGLSKRETEILRYLSTGRTRTYIAEALFISESTVASHSKRIYQKLGVHSKRELMELVDSIDTGAR